MISRRQFIFGSALVVGGAATGVHLYRSNFGNPGKRAVAGVIVSLAELPGAVRFGEKFRKQQNSKEAESVNSIADRLHKLQANLHQGNINDALEQQIQIELRTNQVVLVDDWYLARTEAELCALASVQKKAER